MIEDLREDHSDYFETLCKFEVPFREFDQENETYAEAPLIKCASDGSIESFRFSNQLMQMISPSKKGIKEFYIAYHELSTWVFYSKYFIPNGKRHLQDAYFVYDNAANNIVLLSN